MPLDLERAFEELKQYLWAVPPCLQKIRHKGILWGSAGELRFEDREFTLHDGAASELEWLTKPIFEDLQVLKDWIKQIKRFCCRWGQHREGDGEVWEDADWGWEGLHQRGNDAEVGPKEERRVHWPAELGDPIVEEGEVRQCGQDDWVGSPKAPIPLNYILFTFTPYYHCSIIHWLSCLSSSTYLNNFCFRLG